VIQLDDDVAVDESRLRYPAVSLGVVYLDALGDVVDMITDALDRERDRSSLGVLLVCRSDEEISRGVDVDAQRLRMS
jgi:hypothetical protein